MRPSYVATIPADALPAEPQSGVVLLGVHDGLAYLHVAPHHDPVRIVGGLRDGAIVGRELAPDEPAPDGAQVVVFESVVAPVTATAEPFWTPADGQPFRWDDFAAAHPALAADTLDPDGQPVPPILRPHQWAGE